MAIGRDVHYEHIYNNFIFSEFEILNKVCSTLDVGPTSTFS